MGKSGTKSDIEMFNRKTQDCIYTFMSPVENKLKAKTEIMTTIDVAIVSFKEMTPEVGETILMLESMGVEKGLLISPYLPEEEIRKYVQNTCLNNYIITKRDKTDIMEILSKFSVERKEGEPVVIVDHSFSVKGVGEVVLGLVERGTVRKHDKLFALPTGKEVTVRSIQMQDKDEEEAGPGSRVGLAIRGAKSEELSRGTHICKKDVLVEKNFLLDFNKNKFYNFKEGKFHLTVGMQTVPVQVKEKSGFVEVNSDKKVAFSKDDRFVLIDLNASEMHLIGSGLFRDLNN